MGALQTPMPSEHFPREGRAQLRRERGLYCGLPGGKEELQKRAYAFGPGGFVVLRAVDHFKMQIATFLPAALAQRIAQRGDVRDRVRIFLGADVEPNPRPRVERSPRRKLQNGAAVPPHGRRQHRELAEYL